MRSEDRYRRAAAASGVGIWNWDLATGELYVDPILKEMLGYEDREIRNHLDDWGRLVHPDDAAARGFTRPSNRAGGLEGGITNGMPVVCRAAMKPIATLKKALPSVDVGSKEAFEAAFERGDVCAVAAASVVGEAMVAIALATALLEKLGGDSLRELTDNLASYRRRLAEY